MSRKGHTAPLPAHVRVARVRRKAVAQVRDLIVCMEHYYDNRGDYTHRELNTLEETVQILRDQVSPS